MNLTLEGVAMNVPKMNMCMCVCVIVCMSMCACVCNDKKVDLPFQENSAGKKSL